MEFKIFSVQTGYYLICYIRVWQDALNEVAAENELLVHATQFNTYIISVLVIFFLQVNHELPILRDIPASQSNYIHHVQQVDEAKLKRMVCQFFKFYGEQYQMDIHVISLNIGQWQEREQLNDQQINLSPEQKRFGKCAIKF